VLVQFPQVAKAESENWFTGWGYRKSLIVSTGIHVITVHYGSGNDVLGHIYINGKCQADFDDICFTTSDGKTLVADVDDDSELEIVTGGYFNDGTQDVAQLTVWDGKTLEAGPLIVWY